MLQAEQILHDRYQLQQKLGRTAAGRQTWLTVDLQSNEQVIVKLLAFSPQLQWDELKLFEREAQVLASLNHPRIPRYRDYFSLDGQTGAGLPWFGLVQDYIPGATLQELLDRGKRFAELQVRKIATQVLKILIYLHELSPPVLHRDIKPSNLILGEDEQVYLVDFGAVQDKGAFTGVTFTVVGTSGYAPLEQFWGRAVPASDLYALGATLIHLVTGIAPVDLPQKDSRIQFANRVSLNPSFVSWIENITEPAIEKRFSTARLALEELQSGQVRRSSARKAGGYPTLPAMRTIAQPTGTHLKVNKTAERLEIHVPAGGMRRFKKFDWWRAIANLYVGMLFLFFMSAVGVFIAPALLLLWLIFGAVIFAYFAKLFGEKTHVYFEGNYFKLERQTFRFIYGWQRWAIGDIVGIFLHSDSSGNEVRIRTRDRSYKLGGALSEIECAWLAQEIQDWLNSRMG